MDGFVLAMSLAVVGTGLILRFARKVGVMDIPNDRSSHSVPTPRGGGLALVGSVLAAGAYQYVRSDRLANPEISALAAAALLLATTGWLDDRASLSVRARLAIHATCGLAVAALVNRIAPLPGAANIVWLACWAFWSVASINIVNFMDGIDGMVATQGVVYGVFLFALLPYGYFGGQLGLVLAGACAGFLIWNWAPARIFMGDIGSGPLGLIFVVGGTLAVPQAEAALVFLPLFPLFLDAFLTMARRVHRGERLTTAHRSHLYQRLANGGCGHALVTASFALAASAGAVVALFARDKPPAQLSLWIASYCAVIVASWVVADARAG